MRVAKFLRTPAAGLALLVVALLAMFVIVPDGGHQVAMSVTRKSPQYVELSFGRDQKVPRCESPKHHLTIRFNVVSHLQARRTLRYEVAVRGKHRVRPVVRDRVSLAPGEALTLSRTFKRPTAKRYAVLVSLPGQPELIRLRCTKAATHR